MQDLQITLFATEAGDDMFDDEIDELFGQLETIQPPESLVGQILAAVAQLPSYSQMQSSLLLDGVEGLVIHGEYLDPS